MATWHPTTGTWDDWLAKRADEARSERVQADDPLARRALLTYRRLGGGPGWSLLEIEPQTGRMHQIRIQSASRGWPVRGDVLYGSREPFGPPVELPRDRVIALHGRSLTFLHPIRYEPITVTAELPETWRGLVFPGMG